MSGGVLLLLSVAAFVDSPTRPCSGWVRDLARVLTVLQIAAIFVLGAVTIVRFHIFAAVDERAHVAYVQEVAEHHRLPWLGRDYVSWQELAIEDHTYPRASSLNPRLLGFGGYSYEAWQPPLYYVLAAPTFLIPKNYRDKILAVRAFDLLLLVAAVAILALLAKAVFKERWRVPYCLALSTILWPGVIVRVITVSNAALAVPLVLLYALTLWNATARPRPRSLVAAGGLLGLCVLTQLTLVCLAILLVVPLIAYLRERRERLALGVAALTLTLPIMLVAPWLTLNESRYGALTASSLIKHLQESYEPIGRHPGFGVLTSLLWRFTRAALPQEWWQEYKGMLGAAVIALTALLLIGSVPVVRDPRMLRSRAAALLGAPLLLILGTLVGIVLVAEWPASFLPRFVNPMLPLFALFTAWAWTQARKAERSLLGLAALSSFVVGLIWIYTASAYYFTNIGAMFGIHAAPVT
jgi:4-amino-4-deoxy-L-arabinose transferase-like glycosyltransferase